MLVCFACRRAVGKGEQFACSNCGSSARADVNKNGRVIALYGDTDVACMECGELGHDLDFRRYRRVVGLLIMDRIHNLGGYFCRECRRRLFWRYQLRTLLLGWWGLLALFVRNPYAIAVNFKALRAAPSFDGASSYGALTLDEFHYGVTIPEDQQDPWHCRGCGGRFWTYQLARRHAEEDHPELSSDEAVALLEQAPD